MREYWVKLFVSGSFKDSWRIESDCALSAIGHVIAKYQTGDMSSYEWIVSHA